MGKIHWNISKSHSKDRGWQVYPQGRRVQTTQEWGREPLARRSQGLQREKLGRSRWKWEQRGYIQVWTYAKFGVIGDILEDTKDDTLLPGLAISRPTGTRGIRGTWWLALPTLWGWTTAASRLRSDPRLLDRLLSICRITPTSTLGDTNRVCQLCLCCLCNIGFFCCACYSRDSHDAGQIHATYDQPFFTMFCSFLIIKKPWFSQGFA